MPNVTYGDIDRVASTIADARNTLNSIMGELGPHVWSGPDADRFRSQWESEVSAQLLTFERAVRGMSTQTYRG